MASPTSSPIDIPTTVGRKRSALRRDELLPATQALDDDSSPLAYLSSPSSDLSSHSHAPHTSPHTPATTVPTGIPPAPCAVHRRVVDLDDTDDEDDDSGSEHSSDREFLNDDASESDYSNSEEDADFELPSHAAKRLRREQVRALAVFPGLDKLCHVVSVAVADISKRGGGIVMRDAELFFHGAAYIPTMPLVATKEIHCRHFVASGICDFCRMEQHSMVSDAATKRHAIQRMDKLARAAAERKRERMLARRARRLDEQESQSD